MSTQYRLVQSEKTASDGCSAGQGSSEPVAPRIFLYGRKNIYSTRTFLQVFENRVLRRIFGTNGDGITGDWDHRGRAMTQAVSHRPLNAEARVRARVNRCGICGGQSGTETGFLRVLRFSPVNIIPPSLFKLISSSGSSSET
jgi:hypothetical protein